VLFYILFPDVDCIADIWMRYLKFALYGTAYSARAWIFAHKYQRVRSQVNQKHSRAYSFIYQLVHPRLLRPSSYLIKLWALLFFLQIVPAIITTALGIEKNSVPDVLKNNCNVTTFTQYFTWIMPCFYVVAVLSFAFVLRTASDGYHIRDELRMVAGFWTVGTILWGIFTYGSEGSPLDASYYVPGFIFVELAYIGSFFASSVWVWWMSIKESKKKNGTQASTTVLRLSQLLEDAKFKKDFAMFLCLQLCIENLHFWEAVQKYRTMQDNEARTEAKLIFEKYLDQGGPYEVTVPSKMKKEIEQQITEGRLTPILFDEAAGFILDLMEQDSFPRFLAKCGFPDKYVGIA